MPRGGNVRPGGGTFCVTSIALAALPLRLFTEGYKVLTVLTSANPLNPPFLKRDRVLRVLRGGLKTFSSFVFRKHGAEAGLLRDGVGVADNPMRGLHRPSSFMGAPLWGPTS